MTDNKTWSDYKNIMCNDILIPCELNGELPLVVGTDGKTAIIKMLGTDIRDGVIITGGIEHGVHDYIKFLIALYTEKYTTKEMIIWISDCYRDMKYIWEQCPMLDAYYSKEDCITYRPFDKLRRECERRRELVHKYGNVENYNSTNPEVKLPDILAVYLDVNTMLSYYTGTERLMVLNELQYVLTHGNNLGIHIILTENMDEISIPMFVRNLFNLKLDMSSLKDSISIFDDNKTYALIDTPKLSDEQYFQSCKNNM